MKRTGCILSFVLLTVFLVTAAMGATVSLIGVDPDTNQVIGNEMVVSTGDTFSTRLIIFGVADTGLVQDGFSEFHVDIAISGPAEVTNFYHPIQNDPAFTLSTSEPQPDGAYYINGVALRAQTMRPIILADIEFECLGIGGVTLMPGFHFGDDTVNFDFTSYSLGPGGNPVPYDNFIDEFTGISVSQVPIPPTVLILGAGLVGLAGLRRRVRS